jgi:hypothetical protein
MFIGIFIFLIIVSAFGLVWGIVCILNPPLIITLQRKFYTKINWRIEPISLDKEIRNTRFMGYISFILAMAILILVIKQCYSIYFKKSVFLSI